MSFSTCEDKAAEVVQLLLDQQGIITDQGTACSLLRVCKAWRAAVQRCKSGQVSFVFEDSSADVWLYRLAKFASWLPKHSGLLGSLVVEKPYISNELIAATFLTNTLLEAAPYMSRPWALQTNVASEKLMQCLAASSPTQLRFTGYHLEWHEVAPLAAGLTSLQQLYIHDINIGEMQLGTTSRLLPLANLQRLTQLTLNDIGFGVDLQHLPSQLLRLKLFYKNGHVKQPLADALQRLPQLQYLYIDHWADNAAAMQRLITVTPRLTQLTEVVLCGYQSDVLVHAAPALGRLPALQRLECGFDAITVGTFQGTELVQMMQHLAAATTLTKLAMCLRVSSDCECPGKQLARLTNLQHLELGQCPAITASGAQRLATLTSLTYLGLGSPGVDDGGLSMLAMKLTNLKHLEIRNHNDDTEWGLAVLPVLGQLTKLTHLWLNVEMDLSTIEQGLLYLTGLSQLKVLGGVFDDGDLEAIRAA